MSEYVSLAQRRAPDSPLARAESIASQLGIDRLTALILQTRGVSTIDEAERFLNPRTGDMHSPFLFADMRKAVARLDRAVSRAEKILVVADYDADGVCSGAIMHRLLERAGAFFSVRIPDRIADGYGLSEQLAQKLLEEERPGLVITVDNGISAAPAAKILAAAGVDLIVCDHHTPPKKLPEAHAIINPKLGGEPYPDKNLCGAGIALKLAMASGRFGEDDCGELLALAAVASVADVVPLTGENRIIVALGLAFLEAGASPGLSALRDAAGIKSKVTSSHVAYQIAPRLNAAGRLGDATLAMQTLVCRDADALKDLAEGLDGLNRRRQEIEENLMRQASEWMEAGGEKEGGGVLFVPLQDAHEGVVGIVAGKLCESLNRPCAVLSVRDGIMKGSARSREPFALYDALAEAQDYYISFGGHERACGLTFRERDFDAVRDAVNLVHGARANLLSFRACAYDLAADLGQITFKLTSELDRLAPFGEGNPRPAVLIEDITASDAALMGQTKEHLSCQFVQARSRIRGVGFFKAGAFDAANSGRVDLVASPSINEFRNKTSVQLEIVECLPAIEAPAGYPESLYGYFTRFLEGDAEIAASPPGEESRAPWQELIASSGTAAAVYGRDALRNVLRLAVSRGQAVNLSYFDSLSEKEGVLNVFVNPVGSFASSLRIVHLDEPCFFGHDALFALANPDCLRAGAARYRPHVNVDRDYMAFAYSKLAALPALGGSIDSFLGFLNQSAPRRYDYFTLRVCLDALSQIGLLTYRLTPDRRLGVELEAGAGQKGVNSAPVMVQLRGGARAPAQDHGGEPWI